MKNSKALSIIMNIIITLLAIFCFLSFIEMSGSFKYAKNQEEKRNTDTYTSVMRYRLEKKMYEASDKLEFERARVYRDRIRSIERLGLKQKVVLESKRTISTEKQSMSPST